VFILRGGLYLFKCAPSLQPMVSNCGHKNFISSLKIIFAHIQQNPTGLSCPYCIALIFGLLCMSLQHGGVRLSS
jgi:hypothetical protein